MRINVYTPTEVRFWVQLIIDDYRGFRLDACEDDSVGELPEWWGESDDSVEDVISPTWNSHWTWPDWALEEGLCPRQAFLVVIGPPDCQKYWTDCGYEYDVIWDYDIVLREEVDPEVAALRWSRFMKRDRLLREAIERNRESAKQLQLSNFAAMSLRWDVYWTRRAYSEGPPDGSLVRLVSSYRGLEGVPGGNVDSIITEGRSDKGSHDEAMTRLIQNAAKLNIPQEVILGLRRAG